MQGHRLLRGVGILIIIVAIVYLLLAIGGAIWLGNRGVGDGWGTGWTGWLTIPLAGGAVFAALMLLVFGLMLFFLAKIDNNIAEAERRRMEAMVRPRAQPSVSGSRVATANLPDAPSVAAPVVAGTVAATAVAAAAVDEPVEETSTPAVELPVAAADAEIAVDAAAPWEDTRAGIEEPAAAAEAGEVVSVDEVSLPVEEVAGAADTVLPSVEIEEPLAEWGAAPVAAAAVVEAVEPEVALPELSRDLAVEVHELEVEAPPDLSDVEIPAVVVPTVEVEPVDAELERTDLPEVDVPEVVLPGAVEPLDAELAGVDMPEITAPELAVEAPAVELSEAALDDLNVPPVLPEEIELPRVDVSAPEVELETEDMSAPSVGITGAALAAGAVAVTHEPAPEPEPEPVALPAADARLPEVEITEVAPEPEVAAAEATLAAATGVPETEAAPATAPAEVSEVAQLKAEVASLKEMLAQLAAQLLPAAGAAAAGTAAAAAPAQPEPAEPPAAVNASNKLPGTDEVARIAAEMNAAGPRRPRTVAKPMPPELPAAAETPAPEPPVEVRAAAPADASEAVAPVVTPGEDNLEVIAGLGPIYAKRLRELGVTTFAQLADAPYDVLYKVTRGNLERVIKEDWRGQARRLAKKD